MRSIYPISGVSLKAQRLEVYKREGSSDDGTGALGGGLFRFLAPWASLMRWHAWQNMHKPGPPFNHLSAPPDSARVAAPKWEEKRREG